MFLMQVLNSFFNEAMKIFYFPIWWYSKGSVVILKKFSRAINVGNQNLAVNIWVKNWFVPMFGQNDWEGKIISVFIRSIQIFVRIICFLLWCFLCSIFYFVLFVGPIICFYFIINFLLPDFFM